MPTIRQEKVARLIQKEVAELLHFESKNISASCIVSVTVVRISPDLGYAKCYLSIFNGTSSPLSKQQVFEYFKENILLFRKKLGERVKKQLRVVPELEFFLDDSIDYFEKIDALLKK
jgi:ribosome-binding factor A